MTPSPHPKSHIPQEIEGGGMWVSNGLLVWSIFDLGGGGGMQYNHSCFSGPNASMCLVCRWVL